MSATLDPNLIKKYYKNQRPPKLDKLEEEQQKFTDPYFPPNLASLLGTDEKGNWLDYQVSKMALSDLEYTFPGVMQGHSSLCYKRISEISDKWNVFE